jgi:hypothetical protein
MGIKVLSLVEGKDSFPRVTLAWPDDHPVFAGWWWCWRLRRPGDGLDAFDFIARTSSRTVKVPQATTVRACGRLQPLGRRVCNIFNLLNILAYNEDCVGVSPPPGYQSQGSHQAMGDAKNYPAISQNVASVLPLASFWHNVDRSQPRFPATSLGRGATARSHFP